MPSVQPPAYISGSRASAAIPGPERSVPILSAAPAPPTARADAQAFAPHLQPMLQPHTLPPQRPPAAATRPRFTPPMGSQHQPVLMTRPDDAMAVMAMYNHPPPEVPLVAPMPPFPSPAQQPMAMVGQAGAPGNIPTVSPPQIPVPAPTVTMVMPGLGSFQRRQMSAIDRNIVMELWNELLPGRTTAVSDQPAHPSQGRQTNGNSYAPMPRASGHTQGSINSWPGHALHQPFNVPGQGHRRFKECVFFAELLHACFYGKGMLAASKKWGSNASVN